MRTRNIIALAAAVTLLLGAYALKEFNRGVADVGTMPVKERTSAVDLYAAFSEDEQAATAKFVGTTDQVVQVTGTIRALEPIDREHTNVLLESGDPLGAVVCEFDDSALPGAWEPGMAVTLNGVCSGLLIDVILVRCVAAE